MYPRMVLEHVIAYMRSHKDEMGTGERHAGLSLTMPFTKEDIVSKGFDGLKPEIDVELAKFAAHIDPIFLPTGHRYSVDDLREAKHGRFRVRVLEMNTTTQQVMLVVDFGL
jgi:hypothetical protein